MTVRLKHLQDQVIVITGATSGIGLVTARKAAERGARLVLAARSEDALRLLANEFSGNGGNAVYVTVDVGKQDDVRELARVAQESFGGFDTWINNAGVSIYGKLEEVPIEDMRKLFETNFWGVVYGSLEAAAHLKPKGARSSTSAASCPSGRSCSKASTAPASTPSRASLTRSGWSSTRRTRPFP